MLTGRGTRSWSWRRLNRLGGESQSASLAAVNQSCTAEDRNRLRQLANGAQRGHRKKCQIQLDLPANGERNVCKRKLLESRLLLGGCVARHCTGRRAVLDAFDRRILLFNDVRLSQQNSFPFGFPTIGAAMLEPWLALLRQILVVCLLSLFVTGAALADPPIAAVNTEHGLAIKGYDPVAYFTTGKPSPGLAQFSTTYKGVTYRFASAENRDRFIAAPEKFLPQYGGYCAFAIALNKIADIDPEEWAIIKDKLYLNNGFLA